jgi:hypothetical protein
MIKDGSDFDNYDQNVDLYLDFHRALDEVVEIFTIYSKKQNFQLVLPDSGYRTWYDAAIANLEEYTVESTTSRGRGRSKVSLDIREPPPTDRRDNFRDKRLPPSSSLKKNRKLSTSSSKRNESSQKTTRKSTGMSGGRLPYGTGYDDDGCGNDQAEYEHDRTDNSSVSMKPARPPSSILGLNLGRGGTPAARSRHKKKPSSSKVGRESWG